MIANNLKCTEVELCDIKYTVNVYLQFNYVQGWFLRLNSKDISREHLSIAGKLQLETHLMGLYGKCNNAWLCKCV